MVRLAGSKDQVIVPSKFQAVVSLLMCREQNWGLLQEQQLLLTEPPFSPCNYVLTKEVTEIPEIAVLVKVFKNVTFVSNQYPCGCD